MDEKMTETTSSPRSKSLTDTKILQGAVLDSRVKLENLDHFQIETLIARGGMASIFRCIDIRTGRRVAIKVPHPEVESDSFFCSRFRREVEICKRLNHPSILK
jgi:serine/threonine protein kinase